MDIIAILTLISAVIILILIILAREKKQKKKSSDSDNAAKVEKETVSNAVESEIIKVNTEVKPKTVIKINRDGNRQVYVSESHSGSCQKSLDQIYAEKNGMWVCEYCQTLNPGYSSCCAACGKMKLRSAEYGL